MNKKYNITKCVCYDTTFEEMKKIMKENNISTIEELIKIKTLSSNCKLCRPYINRMIETGETRFDTIIE